MQESWGIVFALGQAFLWAVTSVTLRSLSTHMDPFLLNGLRAAVGLLVVIPLAALSGATADYQRVSALQLGYLAASVFISGVLGDAMYVSSLKLLGIGRAFPLSNIYPLFTVLSSALILGESITWSMLAGMVLVLMGVYLVARPPSASNIQHSEALPRSALFKGVALALAAAVLWGVASVILALGLEGMNSNIANSLRLPVVMLISLGIAAGRGALSTGWQLSRRALALVLLSGILGWGLGGTLFVAAIQLAGPSRTSIIGAASPLFSLPLGFLLLGERPTLSMLIGSALTIAGVIMVI